MSEGALRFGILGAARIAPHALIDPASRLDGVEVVAVAARDRARAERFATRWRVPQVVEGYEALVAHPDIDAVYVALPASLHREWTVRAVTAGKHVLVEKPFSLDAVEAAEMVAAGEGAGVVVGEAAVYLDPALGGGALFHLACYGLGFCRLVAGGEPEQLRASMRMGGTGVDVETVVDLTFGHGVTGRVFARLDSPRTRETARVIASRGEVELRSFVLPHLAREDPLRVRVGRRERTERPEGDTTYFHQLRAFRDAVRGGKQPLTGGQAPVAAMRVLDAVRAAATDATTATDGALIKGRT
jgi:predicted dehydrogenase